MFLDRALLSLRVTSSLCSLSLLSEVNEVDVLCVLIPKLPLFATEKYRYPRVIITFPISLPLVSWRCLAASIIGEEWCITMSPIQYISICISHYVLLLFVKTGYMGQLLVVVVANISGLG